MRMMRCAPLGRAWFLCGALLCGSFAPAAAAAAERPNVLLIVADDLGWSDLGAFGGEIHTPSLDALAARGLQFTHFYTAAACSPSRAMLLTGVDQHRTGFGTLAETRQGAQHGAHGYEGYLSPNVVTVPELLRAAGYRTAMAGKWHLGLIEAAGPHARGFDRSYAMTHGLASHYDDGGYSPQVPKVEYFEDGRAVVPPQGFYSTDAFTDRVIEYIDESLAARRPFFAYLPYTAPHFPLHAPPELIEKYVPVYERGWDALREQRAGRLRELGLIGARTRAAPRMPGLPAWSALPAAERRYEAKRMAIYAAMVERIDQNVGRLLRHLERRGIARNTIVVFLSDNGAEATEFETVPFVAPWFAEHYDNSYESIGGPRSFVSYGPGWAGVSGAPLSWHKGLSSDGGIRAPLIVAGTGIAAGRRAQTVTVADLAATLLELTGVRHPGTAYAGRTVHALDGVSFAALLQDGADAAGTRFTFAESYGSSAVIFEGRWKALRLGAPWGDGRWKLYDVRRDPAELDDRADEQRALLAKLTRAYDEYVRRVGVVPAEREPATAWGYSSRYPDTPATLALPDSPPKTPQK